MVNRGECARCHHDKDDHRILVPSPLGGMMTGSPGDPMGPCRAWADWQRAGDSASGGPCKCKGYMTKTQMNRHWDHYGKVMHGLYNKLEKKGVYQKPKDATDIKL